ncbi:MAG: hypothetical protein OEY14_10085 [Myxococcales bacterium]|nr:hypothetical protein [Myxococcales bacterium]
MPHGSTILLAGVSVDLLRPALAELGPRKTTVRSFSTGWELLEALDSGRAAAVLCAPTLSDMSGIALLRRVHERSYTTSRLLLAGPNDLELALEASREVEPLRLIPSECPGPIVGEALIAALERYESLDELSGALEGRILILDDDAKGARDVVRHLQEAKLDVRFKPDERLALTLLGKKDAPPVIVTSLRRMDAASVIRLVREDAKHRNVCTLALTSTTEGSAHAALWSAGADRVLPRPFGRAEIIASVRAELARIYRAKKTVARFLNNLRGRRNSMPAEMPEAVQSLAQTSAWRDLPRALGESLSGLLECPIQWQPGGLPDEQNVVAVAVRLSNIDQQLEAAILIGATSPALTHLGETLMPGEEYDQELLTDLVWEASNVMMGAVKQGLLEIDYRFVGGIPVQLQTDELKATRLRYPLAQRFTLTLPTGGRIDLTLTLGAVANREVLATDLEEGMVLAEPLYGEGGVLFAARGTRLTTSLLHRLQHRLGRNPVRVAAA